MNNLYNLLAIIFSILIPIVLIKKQIKKEKNIIDLIKNNKYILTIYVLLVIGFILRAVFIVEIPNALNVDELSTGYDAFSISKYGIDRNNNFMPIYLEAWGSGQSAVYAYLTIPFIKILGLNTLTIRLPMAIIGCVSIVVFYKILKNYTNENITLIGTLIFVIAPWHIMKSRWGMDCNIFPDTILYAVYFILKYLRINKSKDLYIASLIIALSSYTYATSFFFLPIFAIVLFFYFLKNKKINFKQTTISFIIMFIIAMPMIIYVIINKFDFKSVSFFITIPKLAENRFEEVSSIFNSNFIKNSLNNFINALFILVKQNDNLGWNDLPIYGFNYIISLPFLIIGIFKCFKEKNNINSIFNIWFISAFLLLFVVEPNINRLNIIIIPLIYYTIIGLDLLIKQLGTIRLFIPIIYISLFISFLISYFTTDWNNFFTFNNEAKNVIEYVENTDAKKIYFEYCFKEPYIYVCFYNKIDTKEYINTVKYKANIGFDKVESFGRYYFYIPKQKEDDAIYVVKLKNINKYKFTNEYNKTFIDDFVVLKKEV